MKYAMGKASWCFISNNDVVKCYSARNKKTVKPARGSLYDCWLREIQCLERFKDKPNFPQLLGKDEKDLSIYINYVGESLFHTWHEHNLEKYIPQVHTIADALEEQKIMYFYPGMDPKSGVKDYTKFPLSNFCIHNNTISLIDFEMAVPIKSKAQDRLSDRLTYLYQFFDYKNFRTSLVQALEQPKLCYEQELMAKLTDKDKFPAVKDINPRQQWNTMTMFTEPPQPVIKTWNSIKQKYNIS
jgi:hypothetical protein